MVETPVLNSYISTAEEADAYFSGDPRAIAFKALDAATKSWYLQRATKTIDALPLKGRKYMLDGSQERQFPREYRDGYDRDELTGETEVPQSVLDACCEEALAIYLQGTSGRRAMQEQGVQSFSIGGKISETFMAGAKDMYYGLRSPDAYRMISKFIARSFPIV